MESNTNKCYSCMGKIKKELDNLGIKNIMTNDKDNILCRLFGDEKFETKISGSNGNTLVSKSSVITLPCPNANSTGMCKYAKSIGTATTSHDCNCQMYSDHTCSYHGENNSNAGTGNAGSSAEALLDSTCGGSLFRIRPDDLYGGIFLHVIKLHGEVCELKMSFGYDDYTVAEIINIIKFLA